MKRGFLGEDFFWEDSLGKAFEGQDTIYLGWCFIFTDILNIFSFRASNITTLRMDQNTLNNKHLPVSIPEIRGKILLIRGRKVMIDRDLAALYGVGTKALNQAVKRNIQRFPQDFMFQMNEREVLELVTICDRFDSMKHSSALPYVFTEHGIAMLSSILKSERAILINVNIIRTFIKLRELAQSTRNITSKISELEKISKKHDLQINTILEHIEENLPAQEKCPKRKIGFNQTN